MSEERESLVDQLLALPDRPSEDPLDIAERILRSIAVRSLKEGLDRKDDVLRLVRMAVIERGTWNCPICGKEGLHRHEDPNT